MKDIKGLNASYWYKSANDHSKWVVTTKSSAAWTCVGDINRSVSLTMIYSCLLFFDTLAVDCPVYKEIKLL